ncbi:uncharacterized protein (TIGR04222 family) [Crossiella equi]|uniref:Uncharacterized protein (TIGR04222 family) n=1 Tax=Crossiella equi TaxID=130796 RepID=A0ABS5ACP4_9PSEU|nr:TIGR04222 domain-containing membrane protein [Crossiella equi]MBP2473470.1 uncharacterized protein (TIGR04222 family) [Crossiella equi]
MHDTWGLTGPAFLVLYLFLLAITAVLVAKRHQAPKHAHGPGPVPELSVDEVAYLAGGTHRLVVTSMARLVEAGALRVSRGRPPAATQAAGGSTVDTAVLTSVHGNDVRAGIRDAVSRLDGTAEVVAVRERLTGLGLLVDPAEQDRASRVAARYFLVPLVLGLLRLADGLSAGKPVWFLVGLLVVTGILAAVTPLLRGPRLTDRGELALRRSRLPGRGGSASGTMAQSGAGVSAAVALVAMWGMTAYPDTEVAQELGSVEFETGGGWFGGGSDGGGSDGGSGGGSDGGSGGGSDGGSGGGCGGGGCGGGGCGG